MAAPAIRHRREVETEFMKEAMTMQLSAGKLWGMRRMADEGGLFKMTAVDQRPPIKGPIAKHHGVAEAPWEEVAAFKTLLIETLQGQSSAMLLDPHFAIPKGIGKLSPTKGADRHTRGFGLRGNAGRTAVERD
jgi:hypothetical protein